MTYINVINPFPTYSSELGWHKIDNLIASQQTYINIPQVNLDPYLNNNWKKDFGSNVRGTADDNNPVFENIENNVKQSVYAQNRENDGNSIIGMDNPIYYARNVVYNNSGGNLLNEDNGWNKIVPGFGKMKKPKFYSPITGERK